MSNSPAISVHARVVLLVAVCLIAAIATTWPRVEARLGANSSVPLPESLGTTKAVLNSWGPRQLSFADRVTYQRVVEEVYWRHRIWSAENSPRPSFDEIVPRAQIERKVANYLRDSQLAEQHSHQFTASQLQAEMNRMASRTKQPEILREIFAALNNDPFVIAECLARPTLAERLKSDLTERAPAIRKHHASAVGNDASAGPSGSKALVTTFVPYTLPSISAAPTPNCPDGWLATSATNAPTARSGHTAVWTGSEMIVWGGNSGPGILNTGGRYNPATDSWIATNTANAPAVRSLHTAIWTGSEMIVWGGYDDFSFLSSGGRYNPATDTWTSTATTNAPAGRYHHTAVWTGSEMIAWGGVGNGYLNTGGRYNPNTDVWTSTSTANAPTGRTGHTAVWTGSEMIVWGGETQTTGGDLIPTKNPLNTGGRYNPISNSWTATNTTGAPSARQSHTAIWTGSEMIVWGGGFDAFTVNTGARYDPSADKWTATSNTNAPAARAFHTAVWTGREMVVWGGSSNDHPVNSGGLFDPGTDTWSATSTANAPSVRESHTAVWTGSEMIVWGGISVGNVPSNAGARYCASCNGNTWTATETTNAPTERFGHTAIWTGSEMIIWGGHSLAGASLLNTGERYNPSTDSWSFTSVANAPSGRYGHSAVWTGTEMIVWGGDIPTNGNGNGLNSGGRYNPLTDSWNGTSPTNAPAARYDHNAVWTGGELIVWGGTSAPGIYLNSGGRYNPKTDSWVATSTANAPVGRVSTAVWTGNEMIVWGGYDGLNYLNNGGRYNPDADTWNGISVNNAPAPRSGHTAVWTGNEMIVWGGSGPADCVAFVANLLNTGGRYNPFRNSWTRTSTTNAPDGQNGHTAIWTGNEMIVWGGANSLAILTGGAEYNPDSDSWSAVSTANAPALRTQHTAVWTGREMIVWGGHGYTNVVQNTGGKYCAPASTPLPKQNSTSTSTIQFSSTAYSVNEFDSQANITVTRTGDTSNAATVSFDTSDDGGAQQCGLANGRASARCNYIGSIGTVSFAPGEMSKTVSIFIVENSYKEGNKTFSLNLSNPSGATLGARQTAWITINDDDVNTGANPIDQAGLFVRQHYLEFLNREPDAPGLAFWTNQISSCGTDQACIEARRVNVSASFFLSIEFQRTGYLVERLYKAAYGDGPADPSVCVYSGSVPIVTLNEFLADAHQVSHDAIVGQGDWETTLANNTQAFVNDFVRRARFANAFPNSLTPSQFVDKLNSNAGNILPAGERTAAIALFGGATETSNLTARAQALRQVAESQSLYNAEFNRAFVLMQYFSYLRRNPTDAPDQSDIGYHFWLNKLNQFSGDFQKAEMVKAFITSAEYRKRFGQQ
jgi:N-acetylneuraminic acid mutarotase